MTSSLNYLSKHPHSNNLQQQRHNQQPPLSKKDAINVSNLYRVMFLTSDVLYIKAFKPNSLRYRPFYLLYFSFKCESDTKDTI